MKKKYKVTAFTRLLIFMIFFAPVAYIGASYYNGEDGIGKIKSFFDKSGGDTIEAQINNKNAEIDRLEKKIEILKRDINRLNAAKS